MLPESILDWNENIKPNLRFHHTDVEGRFPEFTVLVPYVESHWPNILQLILRKMSQT